LIVWFAASRPFANLEQFDMIDTILAYLISLGIVGDRPYQARRSKHWVKVKNRKHPAMRRVVELFA
jgi:hypothetical protein